MKYIVFYWRRGEGNTWESFGTIQEAIKFSQQNGGLIVKTVELMEQPNA